MPLHYCNNHEEARPHRPGRSYESTIARLMDHVRCRSCQSCRPSRGTAQPRRCCGRGIYENCWRSSGYTSCCQAHMHWLCQKPKIQHPPLQNLLFDVLTDLQKPIHALCTSICAVSKCCPFGTIKAFIHRLDLSTPV